MPSVAYIVVENTAQWKMLEATEAKTAKGHEALTLTEDPAATPEPGTLVLLGIAAVAAILWHRRKRPPNCSVGL